MLELSIGAFVLPNAKIPDTAPLEGFAVPGRVPKASYYHVDSKAVTVDAVERAAGIILFSDAVKSSAKAICTTTKCDVTVHRFDDAQKKLK